MKTETITVDELQTIISNHALWIADDKTGVRANLRDADLRGANLRSVDLSDADLRDADLSGALYVVGWKLVRA